MPSRSASSNCTKPVRSFRPSPNLSLPSPSPVIARCSAACSSSFTEASSAGGIGRGTYRALEGPRTNVIDLLFHGARERHNLDRDLDQIFLRHLAIGQAGLRHS